MKVNPPNPLRNVIVLTLSLAAMGTAPLANALDVTVNPGGNIQAALDQVGNAGGGTVYVNYGTYNISTTLKIPNNTRLKGVTTRPIIQMAAGTKAATIESKSNPFTSVVCDFLSLNGGLSNSQMDSGNYWEARALHFADGISGTNCSIYNCNVTNACSGVTMGEVTNGLVQGSNITNCGMAGNPGMHNMYISNTNPFLCKTTSASNGRTGMGLKIQDSDGSRTETSQTIDSCIFKNNYDRGMAVYKISNLIVKKTTCDNNAKSGINLLNCSGITMTDNHATGNLYQVDVAYDIWLNSCSNITQSGNVYNTSRGF